MKRSNRTQPTPGASSSWWARARARVAQSPWMSLAPRGLALGFGLGVLALIGAGAPVPWVLGAPSSPHLASVVSVPEALVDAGSAAPADSATAAPPAPSDPPDAVDGGAAVAPAPILADGRIVLNLAGEAELVKLPGIGPKRAQRILEVRTRLGKFRRVEDLLRVKGIGRKALAKIAPLVVVDRPPEPAPSAP